MIEVRDDGIVELVCDKCQIKLSEVITEPMPKTENDAKFKAKFEAGWELVAGTTCYGCRNV